MSLNIKNPEAHALAEAVAAKTGQSLTAAVVGALREKLARLNAPVDEGLLNEILQLGRDCASRLNEEALTVDHGELLYGEDGLPK